MSEDRYADLQPFVRQEQNLFSFWYPKIQDCGIATPQSAVIQLPYEILLAMCLDEGEQGIKTVEAWVDGYVRPAIKEAGLDGRLLFIKTGTVSNKFSAGSSCLALG